MSHSIKNCRLVGFSSKALLIHEDDLGYVWIPESQVHDDSEIYLGVDIGETGTLVVSDWFAEQKGWV